MNKSTTKNGQPILGQDIVKFIERFQNLCDDIEDVEFLMQQRHEINDGFGISMNITDLNQKLKIVYDKLISNFQKLTENTISSLLIDSKRSSLTSVFNFPEEIQEVCEQYLIYFSKFLKDLGISAATSIEKDAKNILFMVTPDDPDQALSQIKNALDLYLSLPNVPDIENVSSSFKDIGVQQLISNIYHLKSQLLLSQAMIQAKDATIASLNFTNYQQKTLIEKSINEKNNEEKVLNNLVTINEFKGKGFKINLPELFRLIKRKIK